MHKTIVHFMSNEDGATAIEYGLIAAATGLALIAIMPSLGDKLKASLTAVDAGL